MDWTISVNGNPITGGSLTPVDPFTSSNPFNFANGSGSASILRLLVSFGDTITLELARTSTVATFVGVDLTIIVVSSAPVMITTTSLPPYPLCELTTQQLEAKYGIPPYTWSVVQGRLPNGLQLSADGLLQGAPTEAGIFSITVQVTDSTQNTDTRAFDIVVQAKTVWDLAADWSDLHNPNSTWSYNVPAGAPITTHWDNWDPQHCCFTSAQPAWAEAQWPLGGHEALWFKTVSPTTPGFDLPIGTVGTHGFNIPGGPASRGRALLQDS